MVKTNRTKNAGILIPLGRVRRTLGAASPKGRVGKGASIMAAKALEVVMKELGSRIMAGHFSPKNKLDDLKTNIRGLRSLDTNLKKKAQQTIKTLKKQLENDKIDDAKRAQLEKRLKDLEGSDGKVKFRIQPKHIAHLTESSVMHMLFPDNGGIAGANAPGHYSYEELKQEEMEKLRQRRKDRSKSERSSRKREREADIQSEKDKLWRSEKRRERSEKYTLVDDTEIDDDHHTRSNSLHKKSKSKSKSKSKNKNKNKNKSKSKSKSRSKSGNKKTKSKTQKGKNHTNGKRHKRLYSSSESDMSDESESDSDSEYESESESDSGSELHSSSYSSSS